MVKGLSAPFGNLDQPLARIGCHAVATELLAVVSHVYRFYGVELVPTTPSLKPWDCNNSKIESHKMTEQIIIDQALAILESRLHTPQCFVTKTADAVSYLRLQFAGLEHESFQIMFLDSKHGMIAMQELFRGTINTSAVYPREVVKATLQFNAAAVILAHNHPSGCPKPSQADKSVTKRLVDALRLIDVRVLDHIVVGGRETCSFAEHGYL